MWWKNLVFAGVCLVGLATLLATVVPDRPEDPDQEVPLHSDWESPPLTSAVAAVDQHLESHWHALGVTPALPAPSLIQLRRVSLALCGTVPSIEDVRLAERVPESDRLRWWIDRLLADRRFANYQAERMARVWVGVDQGPFLVFRRRRFVSWISDQLSANVPYDDMVRTLITAEGLWTDAPEVNFLTANSDDERDGRPDPIRMAGRTSRAFLGVRLDCVQCHDDNLGGPWLQQDFHRLAAFYAEPTPTLSGIRDKTRDYEVTYLHETEPTVVAPDVPFGETPQEEGASRRARLARWITADKNHAFSRAIVNRIWALAWGRPLVTPIDDIPLDGPFPPPLQELSVRFADHGYDLKWLWRVILTSRAFQLDSAAEPTPTQEQEAAWAVFPVTRLRPEQVAGAMVQACSLRTIDADSHILQRFATFTRVNDFVQRYGDMGQDEFTVNGETIPQRLVMLNGELLKELTKDDMVSNAATHIAALSATDDKAIDAAYLATLTRPPTPAEREHFTRRWDEANIGRKARLEDLFWTLINSSEFSWNH